MAQYIDKDALVAEIERLENDEFLCDSYDEATGFQSALRVVQEFIDTLEVKEINSTDAFNEKAEDYLNSLLYDWVYITNPDQMSCANIIPKKDFIENFRNYIKGE